MLVIKGKVFDYAGAPAARTLRMYRRDTGELLSVTSSAYKAYQPEDPFIDNIVSFITTDEDGNIVDLTGAPISISGTPVVSGGTHTPFSVLLGSEVYLYREISDMSAGEDYTIEGFVSNNGNMASGVSGYTAIASLITNVGSRSTFMLNGSSGRPLWDGGGAFRTTLLAQVAPPH